MFLTLVGNYGHLTGFIQLGVFPCHLGPDESICVGFGAGKILKNLSLLQAQEYQIFGKNISCLLKKLVEKLRQRSLLKHGIKFYLHHFPLSSSKIQYLCLVVKWNFWNIWINVGRFHKNLLIEHRVQEIHQWNWSSGRDTQIRN